MLDEMKSRALLYGRATTAGIECVAVNAARVEWQINGKRASRRQVEKLLGVVPRVVKLPPLQPTLSTTCMEYGLTIKQVCNATGLSEQTLGNWFKSRPAVVSALIVGCSVC